MRQIKRIIVHCAATPPEMDIGAKEINDWHLERGWTGIGYHYVIRRNGAVETGRPVEALGAHARGHNADSIGVCLVGGKGGFNFTFRQLETLTNLVLNLQMQFGDLEVIGHRDVSSKDCPQFDVKAFFS